MLTDEQFDGVAGRVLDYDLFAAYALDYLVSKAGSCLAQRVNHVWKQHN
jgi:hypothetical protein